MIAGPLPIMLGSGTGSEVMRRIAAPTAPMIGGMITAPMFSVLVLPTVYLLLHRRDMRIRSTVGHGDWHFRHASYDNGSKEPRMDWSLFGHSGVRMAVVCDLRR